MKIKAKTKANINSKSVVKKSSFYKVYGKGLIRAYLLSLFLFLISAVLITYTSLSEGIIPILISAVMIISVAFSAIYVSVHMKNKGWLHGALIGLVYMLLIVILSRLFISDFIIDRVVYYKLLICLVTGLVGGMIGINIK